MYIYTTKQGETHKTDTDMTIAEREFTAEYGFREMPDFRHFCMCLTSTMSDIQCLTTAANPKVIETRNAKLNTLQDFLSDYAEINPEKDLFCQAITANIRTAAKVMSQPFNPETINKYLDTTKQAVWTEQDNN